MKAHEVREKKDPVKITLSDGIEREVKFTLNALAELEDRYGSVEAAFQALDNNSIKAVRCILWAGFLHIKEHPISEQEVGDLIDLDYMQDLMEKLGDALEQDLPENDEADKAGEADPNG